MQKLLIIDDDEVDRRAVKRALKAAGAHCVVHEGASGARGIELTLVESFDCILVDYHLPDMNGLDLLTDLRGHSGITAPLVMLTGAGDELVAVEAMKRGAHDYLPKAQLAPESLVRVIGNAIEKCSLQRQLAEAQRQLERIALFDSLTNLGNRRLFRRDLDRYLAVGARRARPFCLLAMDLDEFKAINDSFGHQAGDAVLEEVGRRLRKLARATDCFYRLGGDEFVALLDVDDRESAEGAVKRLALALAEPIPYGSRPLSVGVSVGVALYPADGTDAETLLRAADAAMYRAKRSKGGR